MKDGVQYGHILNPKTGWPVHPAPRSVTVVADSCTEAGLLATLAMLYLVRNLFRFMKRMTYKRVFSEI